MYLLAPSSWKYCVKQLILDPKESHFCFAPFPTQIRHCCVITCKGEDTLELCTLLHWFQVTCQVSSFYTITPGFISPGSSSVEFYVGVKVGLTNPKIQGLFMYHIFQDLLHLFRNKRALAMVLHLLRTSTSQLQFCTKTLPSSIWNEYWPGLII